LRLRNRRRGSGSAEFRQHLDVLVEPIVSVPPWVAMSCALLLLPEIDPCAACRITEPFSDTDVVAEMRPDWFTARPTSEMFPRGADSEPPPRFATVPTGTSGAAVGGNAAPAPAEVVLLTSTSRPRKEGSLLDCR
jgi:hypothetical protein